MRVEGCETSTEISHCSHIKQDLSNMSPLETAYFEPDEEDRLELLGQLTISEPHHEVMQEKKRGNVHFNEQVEIRYLSNEDTTLSLVHKSDVWYTKSDLIAMRKSDREALLVALKSLTTSASLEATRANLGEVGPPPPPPPPPPPSSSPIDSTCSSEPFYFRGMEVILFKRERDECRRRAAEAVWHEQQRQRNRAMLDSALAGQPQQRIADAYRLFTRNVADEAYLRGLGDAKEAREVFQQSLLFPSVHSSSPKPQVREPVSSQKSLQEISDQENGRESLSHDVQTSPTPIKDVVSWKMILQRNSQLRSADAKP